MNSQWLPFAPGYETPFRRPEKQTPEELPKEDTK